MPLLLGPGPTFTAAISKPSKYKGRSKLTHARHLGGDLVHTHRLNTLLRAAIVRRGDGRVMRDLLALAVSGRPEVTRYATVAARTKNTTDTFSDSTTPASGSLSISSPGPGIARFTVPGNVSVDLFFALNDDPACFFDVAEWNDLSELLSVSSTCPAQALDRNPPRLASGLAAILRPQHGCRPSTSALSAVCGLPSQRDMHVCPHDGLLRLFVDKQRREAPRTPEVLACA